MTTGWIVGISLCENPINQKRVQTVSSVAYNSAGSEILEELLTVDAVVRTPSPPPPPQTKSVDADKFPMFSLLAYVVIRLDVAAKAGAGCY